MTDDDHGPQHEPASQTEIMLGQGCLGVGIWSLAGMLWVVAIYAVGTLLWL